jgi:hypothetical protein
LLEPGDRDDGDDGSAYCFQVGKSATFDGWWGPS